ncbi:putative quinol monooxygenase [Uliginosibacterium sp. H1]|uniref:putative quinol monooxygenase n=1 Tax=Uliginosibacterium sp. H1 TaxID=3114757 RepID=UPI002E171662|nr:antibiotic biosynthesis monooxygenase [Uliginosibacterium sp. H1]
MPIHRIGEFTAREGQESALRGFFIATVLPFIRASAGNLGCELLQDCEQARRFVVIEQWESAAAHAASLASAPPEAFAAVLPMLDGMPAGAWYLKQESR